MFYNLYIIKRVNFHSKKLIALHTWLVNFFLGKSWNSLGLSQVMRERIFFPILGFLSCITNNHVNEFTLFFLIVSSFYYSLGSFHGQILSPPFFLKPRLSYFRGSVPKLAA